MSKTHDIRNDCPSEVIVPVVIVGSSDLFMEETLGTVSLSQIPSANSLSRISQANMVGFCLL